MNVVVVTAGVPYQMEIDRDVTARGVVVSALNAGAHVLEVSKWELRDRDGYLIESGTMLNPMTLPPMPLSLNLRAGVGS